MNLLKYIITRLIGIAGQMIGILFMFFGMVKFIPYDPTVFVLFARGGSEAEKEEIRQALYEQWGLNDPVYVQVYNFLYNFVTEGSFGKSWLFGTEVRTILAERLPITFLIFGTAFLIFTPISVILGIVTAYYNSGNVDGIVRTITNATYAIPSYILGLWLIIYFGDQGFDLYSGGVGITLGEVIRENWTGIFSYVWGIIQEGWPAIFTLSVISIGLQFRYIRNIMLQTLAEPYITTARAKGLPERLVIYKHALRNAAPVMITTIGATFPVIFSSSIVLEILFQIPGTGFYMVEVAFYYLDWITIIGISFAYTLIVAGVFAISDIIFRVSDPRF